MHTTSQWRLTWQFTVTEFSSKVYSLADHLQMPVYCPSQDHCRESGPKDFLHNNHSHHAVPLWTRLDTMTIIILDTACMSRYMVVPWPAFPFCYHPGQQWGFRHIQIINLQSEMAKEFELVARRNKLSMIELWAICIQAASLLLWLRMKRL